MLNRQSAYLDDYTYAATTTVLNETNIYSKSIYSETFKWLETNILYYKLLSYLNIQNCLKGGRLNICIEHFTLYILLCTDFQFLIQKFNFPLLFHTCFTLVSKLFHLNVNCITEICDVTSISWCLTFLYHLWI